MAGDRTMFKGWIVRESDAAYLIADNPIESHRKVKAWVPKSVMTYTRKERAVPPDLVPIVFSVESWKEKDLNFEEA